MASAPYLFSLRPYETARKTRHQSPPLPEEVQQALSRLHQTIEAIPRNVMAERRKAWEALRRATPGPTGTDSARHRP